jgi:phage shock protein A
MSEERLERIENQLTQVIQAVGTMQQNMMVMQQNMTVMQQNMTVMQNRMDSMEGTLLTTMTGGFNSLQNYIIDLDTDLAQNERKTADNARNNRRLNQRLMRLENRNDNF